MCAISNVFRFVKVATATFFLFFVSTQVNADNCGDWLSGQCVAHARTMTNNLMPSCNGAAKDCPENKAAKDVTSGDVVKLNLGQYGHVAYVYARGGNSLRISEKNKGTRLSRNRFSELAKQNGISDSDVEYQRAINCGVTEKYGVKDERTINISQVAGVWSPNPSKIYVEPSTQNSPAIASKSTQNTERLNVKQETEKRCSSREKDNCQDSCKDSCKNSCKKNSRCYSECKSECKDKCYASIGCR